MATSAESKWEDQSAFDYDYETLRTTGVILAVVMFVLGILIALTLAIWEAAHHPRQKYPNRRYRREFRPGKKPFQWEDDLNRNASRTWMSTFVTLWTFKLPSLSFLCTCHLAGPVCSDLLACSLFAGDQTATTIQQNSWGLHFLHGLS
ncbi:FXYD domain containing ion transport regulator 7 isoform X1 [Electrophorus electricus]|uniref:FXYD domain containing ion transport regulator 7 isoform X1 n=1 Tax=Electrophorus electricus TaxID=8005 RepID=UPI0015CFC1B9|nr:FXYD domain containing ion transport regulator 7 isoform X1 [Electrophorus electricus]